MARTINPGIVTFQGECRECSKTVSVTFDSGWENINAGIDGKRVRCSNCKTTNWCEKQTPGS